jgi:hypothetical protein
VLSAVMPAVDAQPAPGTSISIAKVATYHLRGRGILIPVS